LVEIFLKFNYNQKFLSIVFIGVFCNEDHKCPENFDWNPQSCSCECLKKVDCEVGHKFDSKTCSCQCAKICKNSCPKNFLADPDKNCECVCTLPAELCPKRAICRRCGGGKLPKDK
jgi:hypothetical protein